MTQSDPLSDMLTRIRNAQMALHRHVVIPMSRLHRNVLEVLEKEGYIRGFSADTDSRGFAVLRVEIKYHGDEPAIKRIERISRPGRRVYSRMKSLTKFYNGYGIVILSTPQGVMSDHEARQHNVGGEVLCQVF